MTSSAGSPSGITRSVSSNTSLARLDSCDGLDTVEREGQFEGVRVRVYQWNKEEKVLFFKNYDLTAQQICIEMAKKVLLQPDSRGMFALWIVGNNLGAYPPPFLLHPLIRPHPFDHHHHPLCLSPLSQSCS